MAAEAETDEMEVKTDERPRSPYAVLVELEGAAVQARLAEYEALHSLLSEHKVKVPKHLFARHCLNVPPTAYLPALLESLGGKKQASEELAREIKSGVTMYLSSQDAVLNPAAAKLLKVAHERYMDVAILTGAKDSVAQALVGRWGGDHTRTKVFAFEPGSKIFPRADVWLKVAKSISRTPRQCIVLAGSSFSAKTALSAGMRCIVIPDEFTAFQDFSGADAVLDPAEDFDAAALFDLIAPVKPFI